MGLGVILMAADDVAAPGGLRWLLVETDRQKRGEKMLTHFRSRSSESIPIIQFHGPGITWVFGIFHWAARPFPLFALPCLCFPLVAPAFPSEM